MMGSLQRMRQKKHQLVSSKMLKIQQVLQTDDVSPQDISELLSPEQTVKSFNFTEFSYSQKPGSRKTTNLFNFTKR